MNGGKDRSSGREQRTSRENRMLNKERGCHSSMATIYKYISNIHLRLKQKYQSHTEITDR